MNEKQISSYDAEILNSDCAMLLRRPNAMNIENVEERPISKNDLGCVTDSVIAVRGNVIINELMIHLKCSP